MARTDKSTIEPPARRVVPSPDPQLKSKAVDNSDDPGWIEGYAAVFNNVDFGSERILPGAFAKSVSEKIATGKVPLMARHFLHGGDAGEVIGSVTEAKEDDHGLWIHANLSAAQSAQDIRQKITEGHVKNLSVGYEVIRREIITSGKEYIVDLLELKLMEVTVTPFPMNELAVIQAAKALLSDASNLDVAAPQGRGTREEIAARAADILPRLAEIQEALAVVATSATGKVDSVVKAAAATMEVDIRRRRQLLETLATGG